VIDQELNKALVSVDSSIDESKEENGTRKQRPWSRSLRLNVASQNLRQAEAMVYDQSRPMSEQ